MKHLKRISAAEVGGMQARTSYISRFVESDLQIYSAFTYDSRFLGPSLTPFFFGLIDNDPDLENPRLTFPINVVASNGIIHTITRVLIPLDLP